ncbi:sperm flagellar protein 1-like isoform X2 [Styela clava]|uniref:sperm flagellar protein 1-like isoform X2 n=1 Tax=Styela clava TaxID=7725 RepID=UPI001939BB47|nr:sperm flagellar protein 1-like isoform X2 [Styela clava]
MNSELSEVELQKLYSWIDVIPLSRKKKSVARDFSDGILVAEVVRHFIPRLVEMHNYTSANSTNQKLNNWQTLNRKVLSKLNFTIPASVMQEISECKPRVMEVFLFGLWQKIEEYIIKTGSKIGGYQERPYYNARSSGPDVDSRTGESMVPEYIVKNPVPLSQLNLDMLDTETRLILEEKEQALLASMETVQILQVKISRLEHLLRLKDLRIQDLQERQSRFDSATH